MLPEDPIGGPLVGATIMGVEQGVEVRGGIERRALRLRLDDGREIRISGSSRPYEFFDSVFNSSPRVRALAPHAALHQLGARLNAI